MRVCCPDPKIGSWDDPKATAAVGVDRVESAIRYALSLPGVATVNLGVHHADQVRQNVQHVKRFRPLSAKEQAKLANLGKRLAPQWGPHFGPVEEGDEVEG